MLCPCCLVALLLVAIPGVLPAGPAQSPAQRIGTILKQPRCQKSKFSIHFRDISTGKTVYGHRPQSALIPASNAKLITTAAALDVLGADFAYETVFALDGNHLVIMAAGDPLTGYPGSDGDSPAEILGIFDRLADQLSERRISVIAGDLVIDDTIFDDQRFHPSWPVDQANRWYAAQVSALNFNRNCIDIAVTPTKPASAVRFATTPQTKYVTVDNDCTTAAKNTAWAAHTSVPNHLVLKGTCKTDVEFPVTIDRPAAFFGYVLAEHLLGRGIRINGKLIIKQLRDPDTGRPPNDLDVIYTHRTPIADVLARANQDSLGLAAECLFKTVGAYYDRPAGGVCRQGSWLTGRAAVTAFLKKLDIPTNQYHIDDGSGLSKKNRLSARCLTTVLTYIARSDAAEMFADSLATGGTGTLAGRRRFAQRAYRDRVQVKTGYVSGARALSGYCQTKDGRRLAFAILSTAPNSAILDQIVKAMID